MKHTAAAIAALIIAGFAIWFFWPHIANAAQTAKPPGNSNKNTTEGTSKSSIGGAGTQKGTTTPVTTPKTGGSNYADQNGPYGILSATSWTYDPMNPDAVPNPNAAPNPFSQTGDIFGNL